MKAEIDNHVGGWSFVDYGHMDGGSCDRFSVRSEAKTFIYSVSLYGGIQQNNGLRGENNLAQRISSLHSRNIEIAHSSAYIRVIYVIVSISEQSGSETGKFLTA